MNKNQKILVSVGVALSLVLSIWAINHRQVTIQTQTSDGTKVGGAVNYAQPFCVNDVCVWNYKNTLTKATTTVCSIVTPPFKSVLVPSSLIFGVTSGMETATAMTIGTSTTYSNATTTLIAKYGVTGSDSVGMLVATTTTANMKDWVFGTSTRINFSLSGATTFSPTGSCQAQFQQI